MKKILIILFLTILQPNISTAGAFDEAITRLINGIQANESIYSVDRDLIAIVGKETMHEFVNKKRDGKTPLHIAISLRRAKYVRYLIENGARLDSRDNAGETQLTLAERLKHTSKESERISTIISFVSNLVNVIKLDKSNANVEQLFSTKSPIEIANERGLTASAQLMQDCLGFKPKCRVQLNRPTASMVPESGIEPPTKGL